tara:strand:+ start:686 stop:1231 length:546 start_codon:yes stop_codon:yes gene_type:complete
MATPTTLPATFTAGQVLTAAQMNALRGAFRILQVVTTNKTDTFTTTSSTFVDVTSLSVSITPSSATSKIFVLATVNGNGKVATNGMQGRLMRDSTAIAVGDAAGSRTQASFGSLEGSTSEQFTQSIMFLDSPATTSSTTYKIQVRSNASGQLVTVNRSFDDADGVAWSRNISTITVMEISA